MKMRFTLLAAAVLAFGTYANAEHIVATFNSQIDLTKVLTPSNSTSVTDTKLPGIAVSGDAPKVSTTPVGATEADATLDPTHIYGVANPDPNDETIGAVVTGSDKGYVRFRYNTGNKGRAGEAQQAGHSTKTVLLSDYQLPNSGFVKLALGALPEGVDAAAVRAELVFEDADGKKRTFVFPEVALTAETQHVTLQSLTNTVSEESTVKAKYIDVYVYGAPVGTFLALEGWGGLEQAYPVLTEDRVVSQSMAFGRQSSVDVPVGSIFIQAECFDTYKEGQTPTHAKCLGNQDQWTDAYGYSGCPGDWSWWHNPNLTEVRVEKCTSITGMTLAQGIADINFNTTNNKDWLLNGMSNVNGNAGVSYGGEYLDETSNLISMEQAEKGFGTFFQYTFDVATDGYLDLTIAAATHAAVWDVRVSGGKKNSGGGYFTGYNKPREEGGYVVEGLNDDWFNIYGFAYVLELDGQELTTMWNIRPKRNPATGALTHENAIAIHKWAEYTDAEWEQFGKYFFVYPNWRDGKGAQWWPMMRAQMIKLIYDQDDYLQGVDDEGQEIKGTTPFRDFVDANDNVNLEDYLHPDYGDIPVTAGTHTITVRATGGATVFDQMMLTLHKDKKYSGIQNVDVNHDEASDFNGTTEYFDLSGRRVLNPANGIFIVKRGNKVFKQVIR